LVVFCCCWFGFVGWLVGWLVVVVVGRSVGLQKENTLCTVLKIPGKLIQQTAFVDSLANKNPQGFETTVENGAPFPRVFQKPGFFYL
jgi:hypothetical protein